MDKMIHLSLNSLDIALRKQAVSAQNLSNVNVTGFRRDVYENFASLYLRAEDQLDTRAFAVTTGSGEFDDCLLYTSPSPRDRTRSRMPSSA